MFVFLETMYCNNTDRVSTSVAACPFWLRKNLLNGVVVIALLKWGSFNDLYYCHSIMSRQSTHPNWTNYGEMLSSKRHGGSIASNLLHSLRTTWSGSLENHHRYHLETPGLFICSCSLAKEAVGCIVICGRQLSHVTHDAPQPCRKTFCLLAVADCILFQSRILVVLNPLL